MVPQKVKKKRQPGIKTLKRKAWDLLSQIIRRSHANSDGMVGCYTCERFAHWAEMDAGHAISGRGNGVLFDERIIRPQCRYCNRMRNGNYEVFITRLMREHLWTADDWDAVVTEGRRPRNLTVGELLDLIDEYKGRLKELDGKG